MLGQTAQPHNQAADARVFDLTHHTSLNPANKPFDLANNHGLQHG